MVSWFLAGWIDRETIFLFSPTDPISLPTGLTKKIFISRIFFFFFLLSDWPTGQNCLVTKFAKPGINWPWPNMAIYAPLLNKRNAWFRRRVDGENDYIVELFECSLTLGERKPLNQALRFFWRGVYFKWMTLAVGLCSWTRANNPLHHVDVEQYIGRMYVYGTKACSFIFRHFFGDFGT